MNLNPIGEPGVSAFLRSVLQNLENLKKKPTSTTYLYYDPKKDLENLKKKLLFFLGLVVDADAKRLDDLCVDQWMDDLNDLLYDVEDILDDIKSLSKDQVSIDYHLLENISNCTNSEFKKILDRAKILGDEAKELDLKRSKSESKQPSITLHTRATSSTVDTSEVIHGREKDNDVIKKRLLEVDDKGKKNYDVVGLWGMGGLGKTTLARQVYNDPVFAKHFEVMRWVCISDVFDVAKAFIGLIGDGSAGDGDGESLESLHKRLKKIVENKRFLFVLDDVWPSTEWNMKWNTLKVPFNSCQNGSKILVTTRDSNIAHALGDEEPYQLKGLPREQCMSLFKDKAFGNAEADEGEKEKLMIWGKNIVEACGGVPLMVKVIGSMLRGAEEEKWRALSEKAAVWDAAYKKNDEIYPAIRLSYHYLPAFLKRCFEYLAILPPNFRFHRDHLVRLWIADGLVQDVDGTLAEDIGKEYFNELKARSLIQEDDTMHDIVHHLVSMVSKKFYHKKNSAEFPVSVRHAYLIELNAMHCEFLAQASCLRTLIVEYSDDENVLLNAIKSCKMLRTLKIKHVPFKFLLEESRLDHLTHIRYLSIIICGSFKELPKDIGTLRNLRILDLRYTSISSLPESICALGQLQVLDLGGCFSLKHLPEDIGNLRSLHKVNLCATSIISVPESILNVIGLQELCVFEKNPLPLNIRSIARLEELPIYRMGKVYGQRLGELNLMYGLGEWLAIAMENIGGVEEAKMAHLKSKNFIRVLEFQWSQPGNDKEMEVKIMEALEPHHALESLTFSNYGGDKLPAWMLSSNICLSNLLKLKMDGLNKIREMIDMEFVLLEDLWIESCPKLKKVLLATPKLIKLSIMNCGEMEPDFVHLFLSLSGKAGLLSIISQLKVLMCAYNCFVYFFEKLKTANLKWEKLERIKLNAGGRRVASLPLGWLSMMESLWNFNICNIGPGMFQFVPDGDQSAFPPRGVSLYINEYTNGRLPHHSYTINSDGKVESEEESTGTEER